jgi:CheY-like chemotaxis protein
VSDRQGILKDIHVLVLEDEPDTRDLVGIVLQTEGASAILVQNVPEALDALRISACLSTTVTHLSQRFEKKRTGLCEPRRLLH